MNTNTEYYSKTSTARSPFPIVMQAIGRIGLTTYSDEITLTMDYFLTFIDVYLYQKRDPKKIEN